MDFCPKCKELLIPRKIGENKYILFCRKCSFYVGNARPLKEKEKLKHSKIGEGIVKEKNELADYYHVCKKCGYEKAQIIDMGVFISDEDNLILLKCGKCGFSERIGRKTS